MANSLGSLVVKLGLDAAEFVSGMTKSEYEAKKFAKAMEANGRVIGQALTIGVTAAASALFLMVKNSIDAADKLNDLSKATGVSVETLGGLGFAAKQSGSDLEGVGKAFGKLRLQIAEAVSGNKEAAQLFGALKISISDLKTLSSEDILFKMADQFATFDEHANTAALANKAFGKSYMDIIPLLSEGGQSLREQIEYYAKWGGVTTDTAKKADEFNDTLGKLSLLAGSFGRELTAQLLPSLNNLAKAFLDTKEQGDGFKEGAMLVAGVLKTMAVGAVYTATEFQALGTVIGARAAQLAAFGRLDFKGAFFIGDEVKADIDRLYAKRDAIVKAIQDPAAASLGVTPRGAGKQRAPGLPAAGAGGADDTAQRLRDAALKDQDRFIKAEEDLLRDREHFLQQYYQDGYISIAEFYSRQQAVRDEAVTNQRAAYAEEEAILRRFKPKDEKERIANEEKLAEVIAKGLKLNRDAAKESSDAYLQATRDAKAFKDSVDQLDISLLAMKGDSVGAGMAAFDKQYAEQRRKMETQGTSTAVLDDMRSRLQTQLELSKATQDYGLTLDELGIAQEHIANLVNAGSITELDALRQKSDLTTSYIGKLREELSVAQALAAQTGKREDIVRVKQLSVQLEGLAMQGDLVAKKFSEIFETSFADALGSAISGTKSLSDAFKDMERSIIQSISKIAAQNIAKAIFGGDTALGGGIGSFFSSLFGGFGSSGGSAALPGGFSGTGFASGTDYARGGWSMVGERGPEAMYVPKGAQIIPNDVLAARRAQKSLTIVQHINVLPGASRATADQAAVAAGRQVNRALYRNS